MKTLLALLIATSLTANAWFLSRGAPPASASSEASAAAAAPPAAEAAPAPGTLPVALLETANFEVLRDRLRAAGAEEGVVRAVLEGALRRRQREQLAAMRIERMRGAWWRNTAGTPSAEESRLLKEIVLLPLRELVGRDPLDLRDAEDRLSFLPAEKRRLLAQIALDYADLETATGSKTSISQLKPEVDQHRLLAEERRKDVLAALTPAERADYELRFEGSAPLLAGRLATMNGTEQEFRALRPLLDDYRLQAKALPLTSAEFSAAYAALDQNMVDRIATFIGPDRALDFLWSGPGLYPALRGFAVEAGLPPTMASRLLQLAADTGARASAIHRDASLSSEQKPAALRALQQAVRGELDALIPPVQQGKLPAQGLEWFTMLGEGRYMGFSASFGGTGSGTIAPTAITTPMSPGTGWRLTPRPRGAGR